MVLTPVERNRIINKAYNYQDASPKNNINMSGTPLALDCITKLITEYNTYNASSVTYQPFGTFNAINGIRNGTYVFAFSDSAYVVSDNDATNPNSTLVTLPFSLDAVAFAYNIDFVSDFSGKAGDFTFIANNEWQYTPGTGTNTGDDFLNTGVDTLCNDELKKSPLRITPEIIYDIYSGSITEWNDYKITNINDDIKIRIKISDTDFSYISIFQFLVRDVNTKCLIKPTYRSDSTNMNLTLTRYLKSVVPMKFTGTPSSSMNGAFSASTLRGTGRSGGSGIIEYVKTNKNSFAYVQNSEWMAEYSISLTMLPPARLKNNANEFVTLNSKSVRKQFLKQTQTVGYYKNNSIAYNSINYAQNVQGGYPLFFLYHFHFYPQKTIVQNIKYDVVCFLIYLTNFGKFNKFTDPVNGSTLSNVTLGQDILINRAYHFSFPSYFSRKILENILAEFPDVKTDLLA